MTTMSKDDGAAVMITVDGLIKSYDSARRRRRANDVTRVRAVNEISFDVEEGELFTLLGPSGCGKTTTLRSIAGLETPNGGRISVGGRVFFDSAKRTNVPANNRGIGMVFQSYAIWPHMTVFKNTSFPLDVLPRSQRPGKAEIKRRVELALSATQLEDYADRPATKLSGGQQQRLALARALVGQPAIMLLDEPLSNLDARLRDSMRFELKRVQRELGITSIYVTHDQSEALVLSSRIAVMNEGKIAQVGRPREIYSRPTNRFVAEFVGVTNLVPGKLRRSAESCVVESPEGPIHVQAETDLPNGSDALVSIRPEVIELSERSSAQPGITEWRGKVVSRAFLGDSADHVISVGAFEIRVRSNPSLSFAPGTELYLTLPPANLAVLRA